ncbi:Electron transfer flavoprotein domain-containing protein [Amphritea atlantica]|uniref:Electron transfer flavoprotein domain-containing protein n=1 Tax=Amphritea atlantica TaxID=355243 RepID=A0A1H9CL62_9GAMM|nr:hypothetical protein [Amphritea atlantica]SEQ01443.1 Electron transfer flavoprotein domain-containing protein [Amphritea atlantica]
MKIAVILTPDVFADNWSAVGRQAQESITEALTLKQSGRAHEVVVVSIGQPLSEPVRTGLLLQGVDSTQFSACDRSPGPMELAEHCVAIIQLLSPDLMFIGRGDNEGQSQLGTMLAELLAFRLSQSDPVKDAQLYRTLVIREIGNGMHTVRVSLLNTAYSHPASVASPVVLPQKPQRVGLFTQPAGGKQIG